MFFHLLRLIRKMSIGIGEILIIVIVAFVFVGPDNLPKLAKKMGKYFNKYKSAVKDIKKEMDLSV